MLISICIPCYRSVNTLKMVVDEVKEEFKKHEEYEYQFVLVNDGSPDNTFSIIWELCQEDPRIIGVNLSKNQGQAAAKLAALPYATGDALIYMDDDGQHPAEGIFALLEKLNEGYDVVFARFIKRKHSVFKNVTSAMKKKLSEWLGVKPKGVDTSPFSAWSKLAMESVKNYHSPFPTAVTYLKCVTDKFADVPVEHRARTSGHSGYNLRKLFSMWLNEITNFSITPLRFASYIGSICAIIGFIMGIVMVVRKLIDPNIISGYTSTMAVILFIGGIIMMMLGIIGEYIGRIYMTVSGKPQFVVSDVIQCGEEKPGEQNVADTQSEKRRDA